MRGLPCVIPLLIGLCLLAACGIKGPPKAPKPKPPAKSSAVPAVPRVGQDLALSWPIIAMP